MQEWKQVICLALALFSGLTVGLALSSSGQAREETATPAFAAWLEEEGVIVPEENLFQLETPEPTTAENFSVEVIRTQRSAQRVLIYHTHTYEAYAQDADHPYKETEKWRTADERYNMVRVGEELAALLRGLGMEVVHDTTAFEPPNLSDAYTRSLAMLEARVAAGESYDLYIDLHRDAYAASQTGPNTVAVGGQELAYLMVLIGKGEGQTGQGFDQKPNWQENIKMARAITDCLNDQVKGLCRDVRVKNGRFNQHISTGCVLIEAGNNRNTLEQVLAAMPYLADAIAQSLEKVSLEK